MFSLIARRSLSSVNPSFLSSSVVRATSAKPFLKAPGRLHLFLVLPRSQSTSAAAAPEAMADPYFIVKRVDNIDKSPHDERQYRGLELSNGLRVLLISDPSTDKSAAALDVACGHLMDRWEMPGTAHFCEHMLFLGTDKYPEENEYNKFIASNAGSSNAFTSTDHTNYHFSVKPDQLEGALDRFVQFFLAPQFTESATEREVCAVDSEHGNNVNADNWRNIQVERSLSRPGHDYGKFGTGNKKTLMEEAKLKGLEPRKELLEFHKKWYSSNIMTCVVVGKESLDELEKYLGVLEFDRIENKNVEKKYWNEHPLGPEQLGRRIQVVPIKDSRSLKISFPVPYVRHEYKAQPDHYLSHLIGHEGKGSLLSELKARGWTSSLQAGQNHFARGLANFDIVMDLSEEGLKHVDDIVEMVFRYVGMLKRSGLPQWVQEELRDIGQARFIFQDKGTPMNTATSMATSLQHVCFEDVISCRYTNPEYKPELIRSILDRLVPENMNLRVISKTFAGEEGNINEPIYGTEMRVDRIPEVTIEKFKKALETPHEAFHLPERNEYIPTKFDLKPLEGEMGAPPRIIFDDAWTRVWFKQDDEYKLPKAVTRVAITTPFVTRCPRTQLLALIYESCLHDTLAEETYNADIAGLSYDTDFLTNGVCIKITGYDEKQPLFVQNLVKRIVDFSTDPVRFDVIVDGARRGLENFAHSQPYTLCQQYASLLLKQKFWGKAQLLAVCKDLSLDEIEKFKNECHSAFHVEVFAHGNITEKEVMDMATSVSQTLREARESPRPLFHNEAGQQKEHCLENGDSVLYRHYQSTHEASCVEAIWQVGVQKTRDDAILQLFVQLVKEPAFNQLRTQEQLGYIVWTGARFVSGTSAFRIILQGLKEPDYVMGRIEAFLEAQRAEIEAMSEEAFKKEVDALTARMLEKPKTLKGRNSRYWDEIECRYYDFERNQKEAEVLKTLKREDILRFIDTKISKEAAERRLVAIFVHGSKDAKVTEDSERKKRSADMNMREIECLESERSCLGFYGLPKPALVIPPIGVSPVCAGVAEEKKN